MTLSILASLAECREEPWKNGGGTTRELWIHPAGSSLAEGFEIRLSVAEVRNSGPFSAFPSIDRTLLLLEGSGVALDFGIGGKVRLPGPFHPVSFRGEWATQADLENGPCRDFNVMTDRRHWTHQVKVLRTGESVQPGAWSLIYAASGPLTLRGTALPAQTLWEAIPSEAWQLEGHPGGVALQISLFRP